MKGKIAVIKGCHWCPYKAFDSSMGIIFSKDGNTVKKSSIAYCGYHKVGYDGSQTRIENTLIVDDGKGEGLIVPENMIDMPDNCPLPYGDDKRRRFGTMDK